MKASIKFRDEQKPLIRAKVPLTILNVPFQSGVVAGESKELSLSLGTFYDSGPSFKFNYRPNDSANPFSLVFKTGIGHFGSPVSSPFTMSAEFNLVGNQNPSFFIHFKPNFGDFSLKKSHSSSALAKDLNPKINGTGPVLDGFVTPVVKPGFFEEKQVFLGGFSPTQSAVTGVVENLFSGAMVSARTRFPATNRAVVNMRWGLRFPKPAAAEETDTVILGRNSEAFWPRQCPLLVMNKIGIEHVAKDASKNVVPGNGELAKACLDVKQQLEAIQSENGLLRNALNDLRSEMASRKLRRKFSLSKNGYDGGNNRESENSKVKYSGKKSPNGKTMEGEVNEELKKA